MRRMILYTTGVVLLALLPVVVHAADLEITEVMYDAEGTDSGREWLEVYNTTGQPIDIAEWEFYENETNHGISARKDGANTSVGAGAYAVIADDTDKFLTDYPNFSGVLVDSAFGLTNSGESLQLRNPAGQLVAKLVYESQDAADGTGGSLQLSAGEWIAASATPGDTNRSESADSPEDDTDDNNTKDNDDTVGQNQLLPNDDDEVSERDITVDAGTNKTEVSGVAINFSGTFEEDGKQVDTYDDDARWSFGNGAMGEGAEARYVYPLAGTYVATLSLTEDDETFTDAVAVEVLPQDISISAVAENYVELTSGMSADVDLGGWELGRGDDNFRFPSGTILLSGDVLKITHEISSLGSDGVVELFLPDGTFATSSKQAVEEATSSTPEASGAALATSEEELLFGAAEGGPEPAVAGRKTTQSSGAQPAPSPNSPANADPTPAPQERTDNPTKKPAQNNPPPAANEETASSVDVAAVLSADKSQAAAAGSADFDLEMFWQWALLLVLLAFGTTVTVILLRRVSSPAGFTQEDSNRFNIEEV